MTTWTQSTYRHLGRYTDATKSIGELVGGRIYPYRKLVGKIFFTLEDRVLEFGTLRKIIAIGHPERFTVVDTSPKTDH